jgi:crossover junction endodeoxyribonuclease RuvC
MTRIIGVDPGLAATGIGIVRGRGLKVSDYSYGLISTSKTMPLPARLDRIFSKLLGVLESEKPDLMVVEDVFSLPRYPRSGITLGKVTGAILLAACRADIPVAEVPVREAKQVLTGNGAADKLQLENAVRHCLNRSAPIKPSHVSDALALALIGLFRHGGSG